ncbi:hypothetical protein [Bradyrhizobium sp.]|uniref:hypothetical protein n=1 Tax=Bradyrhizobium sp. TaxID=376 RepID=UPI0025BF04AF|nr:hypothetical protein [Bradyrhizobium sp.]
MKLCSGLLAAGLALLSASAQAQAPHQMRHAPYAPVSDIGSPYAAPYDHLSYGQRQGYGQGYGQGHGPMLLPPMEVYAVLRESGFSPLGVPSLRGFYYTIAVIDRSGEDGRLIIDARDGRIIRFTPGYRMGRNFNAAPMAVYGPAGPPRPTQASSHVTGTHVTGPPPSSPQVASRTVPLPKANPLAARPAAEPVQQAAAPAPKPAEVQAAAPRPVTTGSASAKPLPQVAPTQDMPNVQGLE